jgi:hypothetical protein
VSGERGRWCENTQRTSWQGREICLSTHRLQPGRTHNTFYPKATETWSREQTRSSDGPPLVPTRGPRPLDGARLSYLRRSDGGTHSCNHCMATTSHSHPPAVQASRKELHIHKTQDTRPTAEAVNIHMMDHTCFVGVCPYVCHVATFELVCLPGTRWASRVRCFPCQRLRSPLLCAPGHPANK